MPMRSAARLNREENLVVYPDTMRVNCSLWGKGVMHTKRESMHRDASFLYLRNNCGLPTSVYQPMSLTPARGLAGARRRRSRLRFGEHGRSGCCDCGSRMMTERLPCSSQTQLRFWKDRNCQCSSRIAKTPLKTTPPYPIEARRWMIRFLVVAGFVFAYLCGISLTGEHVFCCCGMTAREVLSQTAG